MKVFVAGATGVVGKRLVPLLVGAGARVTGVARTREKSAQLEQQGATPVRVDLFDPPAVTKAVAGHDVVINVATKIPSGYRLFVPGAFKENIRIRKEASRNLAGAATVTRARRFIQESFAPAYPDRGDAWIDEQVTIEPGKYIESVRDAESAAETFTKSGGVGVVLRFSMFYGPDSSLTLDMVDSVKRGFAPTFGGPNAFMSSIYTDDAASAVFAALSVPAGVYNVTDDVPLRRKEAFDLLARAMHVKPPRIMPRWLTRAFGSIGDPLGRSHRISNAHLKNVSQWRPRVPSLREGWPLLLSELGQA